jgi:hypothetical protein
MFDRFDDRTLEIETVVVVVVIALVILCYLAIYINPQVFFNPFKPPSPTPEQVAQATTIVGPTWTPTATSTATNTPTSTATWTPTSTPTNTPTPTATNTPTPTSTNTPQPPTATSKPKPRPPTATPTPWPYYAEHNLGWARPRCDWTGVWGYVVGANGLAEANVQVRVGNNQGWTADTWSNENGIYGFIFANEPKAGRWFVRVFKGGQPRSMQFWWDTNAGCTGDYSIQEIRVDWRHW